MHETVAGLFIHRDLPLDEHPFYTTPLHKLANFCQIIIPSKLRVDFFHFLFRDCIIHTIMYDMLRAVLILKPKKLRNRDHWARSRWVVVRRATNDWHDSAARASLVIPLGVTATGT
jgi:hypothetical protein